MFPPATICLHKNRKSEPPSGRILLDCREVLEGLLVERTLGGIGCNQDGLDELAELLVHRG